MDAAEQEPVPVLARVRLLFHSFLQSLLRKMRIFPSAFILEFCYGAAHSLIVYKCCPSLPVLMMLSGTVLTIFPLFFQKRFAALPAGRLPYKEKLRSADPADQAPPCPLPRHGTPDIFLDIKVLLKFLLFASFHLSDPVIQSTVPGLLAGIVDHLCKRLRTSHQCHTRAVLL